MCYIFVNLKINIMQESNIEFTQSFKIEERPYVIIYLNEGLTGSYSSINISKFSQKYITRVTCAD